MKERFVSAINVYDFVVSDLTHVSHSVRDQQPLIVELMESSVYKCDIAKAKMIR